MRVPADLRNEGGVLVSAMADFLDVDEAGVQAIVTDMGNVRLKVDSTAHPSKSAYLEPDDAEALGNLLIQRAHEARKAQS